MLVAHVQIPVSLYVSLIVGSIGCYLIFYFSLWRHIAFIFNILSMPKINNIIYFSVIFIIIRVTIGDLIMFNFPLVVVMIFMMLTY